MLLWLYLRQKKEFEQLEKARNTRIETISCSNCGYKICKGATSVDLCPICNTKFTAKKEA